MYIDVMFYEHTYVNTCMVMLCSLQKIMVIRTTYIIDFPYGCDSHLCVYVYVCMCHMNLCGKILNALCYLYIHMYIGSYIYVLFEIQINRD